MERKKLEDLAREAIPRGITDESLLPMIRTATEIRADPIAKQRLLSIYKRRLKHTGGDLTLLRLTEELVDFLTSYPNDELLMIYITDGGGFYTFLLADTDTAEILHWMRMFGRKPDRATDTPDARN
ncbi:hypothetical protein [Nocardia sp. NPDC005366]|uniref:hypothetical protein n=1 Tax=Nocardia sp. NPDC005366 TaxID=3156878 RepID=UPI0033AFD0DA